MHTEEYLQERLRRELKQQEPAYDLKTTPQLPFAQDEENYDMAAWKDGAPAGAPGRRAARDEALRQGDVLAAGQRLRRRAAEARVRAASSSSTASCP